MEDIYERKQLKWSHGRKFGALLEALQYCRNLTLAKRRRQYDLSSGELIEIG